MRRYEANFWCVLFGHRMQILERRRATTTRDELEGALAKCTRCETVIDWREPSRGLIVTPKAH